mmetsp:Transcript_105911/g.236421  ORF Transcript_105911/g.236421 Transcript_105911/m.236421 type:complete len:389 (+) Transcript_105911:6-1172(+)
MCCRPTSHMRNHASGFRALPSSGGVELVHLPEESLCVVRRVVLHDLRRIEHVDLVDVIVQLRANLGLDLLDFLETAGLHEGSASVEVVGQHLCKLLHHVLQDVGRRLEKGFQCGQVSALLYDALQGPLRLRLQILARILVQVHREQAPEHIRLGEGPRVVRGVAADLTQGPSRGRLEVVLGFVDERVLEGGDALRHHHRQGQGLGECGNVAQRHDARQTIVATGLCDVVDHGCDAARIDDKLCQVRSVAGDLADASRRILPHELVDVLEAMEDTGEDLSLYHDLRQVHGVLRDLSQARADLALEGCIVVGDVLGKERDRARVHNCLGQLRRVLADVAQRGCGDPLERELGLLEAEDQERHSPRIHNSLGELLRVPRDIAQRPCSGFLH